jgi:hypothetical protein
LLLSKWTAVQTLNREKHFVVVRMIEPEPPAVRSLKRHAVQDADSLSRVNKTAWQGRTGLETAKARFNPPWTAFQTCSIFGASSASRCALGLSREGSLARAACRR